MSSKQIPAESARAILTSMVGLEEASVAAIIGPAEKFEAPKPEPAPAPGGTEDGTE